MQRKWGFTLIELIVVVIIIGILATFAVPEYLKATERAKLGKAKNALKLIADAEKMYRAQHDEYIVINAPAITAFNANVNTALGDFMELSSVDADTEWTYGVACPTSGCDVDFTVTATRRKGKCPNSTVTLTHAGVLNDSNFVDACL